MKSLEEARSEVLRTVEALEAEPVSIWESSGRVLASDVVAGESVPPFENSAMDGYAVHGADVGEPGAVLDVIGDLPAGFVAGARVGPGQALKIMTGAPMPDGADTVVKVEDTDGGVDQVTVIPAVTVGTSVRAAGGDVERGSLVFMAGTRLTPMHVGVLATIGVSFPLVHRRPRVAFMSTGDELTPPGSGPLAPGMIRDSNRPMVKALLEDAGAYLIDLGIVPDNEEALGVALEAGSSADVVVSTGGVSMGDYDVTKMVLEGNASVGFWQVAIQPAKPFAFGKLGNALFFGLPGNPVSVLVSFEQFLRPALLRMQGATRILREQVSAVAGERMVTDSGKTVFLRVRISGEQSGRPIVMTSGGQSSNVLSAAAAADALAVIPRGVSVVDAGEDVVIERFKAPETREWTDGS
ncbi:MAG: gephyrin-like molybdotransferase Glp [Acidimicrobiia bacterium]